MTGFNDLRVRRNLTLSRFGNTTSGGQRSISPTGIAHSFRSDLLAQNTTRFGSRVIEHGMRLVGRLSPSTGLQVLATGGGQDTGAGGLFVHPSFSATVMDFQIQVGVGYGGTENGGSSIIKSPEQTITALYGGSSGRPAGQPGGSGGGGGGGPGLPGVPAGNGIQPSQPQPGVNGGYSQYGNPGGSSGSGSGSWTAWPGGGGGAASAGAASGPAPGVAPGFNGPRAAGGAAQYIPSFSEVNDGYYGAGTGSPGQYGALGPPGTITPGTGSGGGYPGTVIIKYPT